MSINDYVNYRLDQWADWYLRNGGFGLGYPKKSVEGKLIDNGGVLIKSTPYLACNASAEEIEHLVVELTKQNERLAQVLREQYFGLGTMPRKAKRLGFSYAYFRTQLDMAKQWMAGRLSITYRED